MTNLNLKTLILLTALSAVCGEPVWAGTYIKAVEQSYTDKSEYAYVLISINQGKLKLDLKGPKLNFSLFYDQTTSLLDFVDYKEKSYFEMTSGDQMMVKGFMHLAMLAVAAQMKTETDPKAIKEMNDARASLQSLLDDTALPSAKGVKFQGFTCDKYATYANKEKTSDYWIAQPSMTALAPEDLTTYHSFLDTLLSFFSDVFEMFEVDIQKIKQRPFYQALTIGSIDYVKGKPDTLFRVLNIQSQAFAATAFSIPAGYAKHDFSELIRKGMESQQKKEPAANATSL